MVDYDKTTGETGIMRIRDLGSVVEYWFRAGYDNNHWDPLRFSYTAQGTTYFKNIDYNTGRPWVRIAAVTITGDQTVTFKLLTDTNTEGMGGPTTFSQFIDRTSRPSPPSAVTLSSITATSVFATFTDGANNGAAIDARQIAYSTVNNSSFGLTLVSSDGSTLITGLNPGTTYYFWARTHNAKGWSNFGIVRSVKTKSVPPPPTALSIKSVTQTTVTGSFKNNGNGGAHIDAYRVRYSLSSSATDPTIVGTGRIPFDATAAITTTITKLKPGMKYYFWVQAHNVNGWSNWSAMSSATLQAGGFVKVGLVHKRAVPYVKVNGVWKVAAPWSRRGGIWKESAS